jgi:hypothetical protein
MKKRNSSKRNDLLDAILSRDKNKLKKVLQSNKPEKWLCVVIDHKEGTIMVGNEITTEEKISQYIKRLEHEYNIRLLIMEFNALKGTGSPQSWSLFDKPDLVFDFRGVGLET